MDVRGHEVQLGVPADLGHLAHHRRAVAGAEAGVDHERRPRADDDADVRHQRHAVVRDRVDVRARSSRSRLRGPAAAPARSPAPGPARRPAWAASGRRATLRRGQRRVHEAEAAGNRQPSVHRCCAPAPVGSVATSAASTAPSSSMASIVWSASCRLIQLVDLPLSSRRTTSPSFNSRMPASTFSRSPTTSQTISSGRMNTLAASASAFSSRARTFVA